MKKRLVVYVLFTIPLAIFTWYSTSLPTIVLVTWAIVALSVAAYEINQSGKPATSAIAVAVFWLVSVFVYTLYWAGSVFLGYGGEQLKYLQVGASPDWLIQDFQFYQHAIFPHLVQYSLIALIVGSLLGAGLGWFLIKSGLLQRQVLQKNQE
jgi:hypothetical protein